MTDFVWNLFVELRKEVLEAQKIRAQILGFKFTFITAAMGIIGAHLNELDSTIFVIPALAAIFFDFIIYSYSFSIKRIGCYVREVLEPELKKDNNIPDGFTMWQDYLTRPETRQYLSAYGNIGVTILSVVIGIIGLFADFKFLLSPFLLCILIVFVVLDVKAYREPQKLGIWPDNN